MTHQHTGSVTAVVMNMIKNILASKDLNFRRIFEHLSSYKCKGKFLFKTEMVKLNAIVRKLYLMVVNIQKEKAGKRKEGKTFKKNNTFDLLAHQVALINSIIFLRVKQFI